MKGVETMKNAMALCLLWALVFAPWGFLEAGGAREIVDVPTRGCYIGVFPGNSTVFEVERLVGKHMAFVLSFTDRWGPLYRFPGEYCAVLWATGHLPMITWQPQTDLASIIAGLWDDYILDWAHAAKEYGHPVMLRFGHEMNGNWYPWCGAQNGGGESTGYGDPTKPDGPERYIDAFRHVHDLFQAAGADNVIWVWAPNEGNPVGEPWNEVENYYPGDEYVDWLGMDGYNWGTSRPWSHWRSFDELFGELCQRLVDLAPDKPIMIAEFASSEQGGDKAAWITDAFQRIKTFYSHIKAVIWFDTIKETEWAINSSPSSLAAFQEAIHNSYYIGNLMLKEGR